MIDLDRGEEIRLQPVVVLLQDRVELVVVAAGAAHAHAQHHVSRHVGQIVQNDRPLVPHVALVVFINAQPQVHRRYQRVRIAAACLVARELLQHELRIGLIAVEGPNHVIAIVIGFVAIRVELVAV